MSSQYVDLPLSGAAGVTSLNGLTGALTLVAGANITITPSGHNITIAGSAGGITQLTGDGTAGPGSGSQVLTITQAGGGTGQFTAGNIRVNTASNIGHVDTQSTLYTLGPVTGGTVTVSPTTGTGYGIAPDGTGIIYSAFGFNGSLGIFSSVSDDILLNIAFEPDTLSITQVNSPTGGYTANGSSYNLTLYAQYGTSATNIGTPFTFNDDNSGNTYDIRVDFTYPAGYVAAAPFFLYNNTTGLNYTGTTSPLIDNNAGPAGGPPGQFLVDYTIGGWTPPVGATDVYLYNSALNPGTIDAGLSGPVFDDNTTAFGPFVPPAPINIIDNALVSDGSTVIYDDVTTSGTGISLIARVPTNGGLAQQWQSSLGSPVGSIDNLGDLIIAGTLNVGAGPNVFGGVVNINANLTVVSSVQAAGGNFISPAEGGGGTLSGGTVTIQGNTNMSFGYTVSSATTLQVSNSYPGKKVLIRFIQNNTQLTFNNIIWPGGTNPIPSTSGNDIYEFYSDQGNNHYGYLLHRNDGRCAYKSASVVVGSAVTLTTATPLTVTSISLPPGDWDISGVINLNGTLTGTQFIGAISQTTNSLTGTVAGDTQVVTPTVSTAASDISLTIPMVRKTLSTTTVIYLIAEATFSAGTAKAYGRISAREFSK